jgi:hypothetical protein
MTSLCRQRLLAFFERSEYTVLGAALTIDLPGEAAYVRIEYLTVSEPPRGKAKRDVSDSVGGNFSLHDLQPHRIDDQMISRVQSVETQDRNTMQSFLLK